MIFGGLQRCSTLDFPGILCCVLFTRSCDLNCFYCHNRALLAKEGPVVAEEEIWAFLEKRVGALDGVVISGGEPTLYLDLPTWLEEIRALGYKTKLDTNGQRPEVLRNLLAEGLLDYVALDIKAADEDYHWVTGATKGAARKARETLAVLGEYAVPYEARTTLYPGLDAQGLLALLQSAPPLPCYRLNLFRAPEVARPEDKLLLRKKALSEPELRQIAEELRQAQPHLVW